MSVSPTLAMNQLMKGRVKNGLECFKFGFGESPFPVPSLLVEELKRHSHQKSYLPSQGLPELRDVIAQRYADKYSADNIIIGPGTKFLLYSTQYIFKRDLVLPAPSWVSYAPQAQYLERGVSWINTTFENEYKLEATALDTFLMTKDRSSQLLILNAPNNPSGHVYTSQELEDLAEVARRHDLIIVSDEIYEEYAFEKCASIALYYPEGTIRCSGLSKSHGAGGWRMGWMCFPDEFKPMLKNMVAFMSETISCVSAPIQYASMLAFDSSIYDDYISRCSHTLRCVAEYVYNHLDGRVRCNLSKGGFYSMVKFDVEETSSDRLCQRIMEDSGVALLSGTHFGQDGRELTARLAYVDFDGKAVVDLEDINGLDANLDHAIFAHLKKGIAALNNWTITY